MRLGLLFAMLMVCLAGEAAARAPGISHLKSLLEGRSTNLDADPRGAVFSPDELVALKNFDFSIGELGRLVKSGCYSDIACETQYRFVRLSDAERERLKSMAVRVVNDCEHIVYGGGIRFMPRWKSLRRLARARQRMATLIGNGSVAAQLIGTICVAQADIIAADKLSEMSDDKMNMIIEKSDDERTSVLHLVGQHADRKPGFQVRVAKLFGAPNCDRHSKNVRWRCAYLADRVLLAFNRPQMFGTQYDCALLDRRDVLEIEQRRKSVGLEPLNEYQRCSR